MSSPRLRNATPTRAPSHPCVPRRRYATEATAANSWPARTQGRHVEPLCTTCNGHHLEPAKDAQARRDAAKAAREAA